MVPTAEELAKRMLEYNPKANIEIVRKAYDFAKETHNDQKRVAYGDNLFVHAVKMAQIVLHLKLDSASVAATLLHNILEYTKTKPERVKELFGAEILLLVEALTKFKRITLETSEDEKAEHFRKVLLASTKDIRVILLKLADVLQNMDCLVNVQDKRRNELVNEALEIYAPIAHKLGMYKLKSEIEDSALPYLDPEKYNYIIQKVAETKEERERQVQRFMDELKGKMQEIGLKHHVYGRAKSYYSIYKKLQSRYSSFDNIHDLLAIRIIVPTVEDCYRVLGVVHSHWHHMPNLFADYIANPKPNGYQSIHTKILYNGKIIEVQIRSVDMHREAEEGIAAHWIYKGSERDKRFDKRIAWLKQILEWQAKSANAKDFVETLKIDLFEDEIVVFTPKGEPITLPENATPLDFAYTVHTDVGSHCARAKINGVLVPLDSSLHSGDVVEILTSKNVTPSRHWLSLVKTAHARNKIRQALHIQVEDKKKPELGNIDDLTANITVDDFPHAVVKFSKCCTPQSGDPITGFKMREGKISVHRGDCFNIVSMKAFQNVKVRWKTGTVKEQRVNITVTDRVGLAAEILNVFSYKHINLISINTKPKKEKILISLGVQVDDEERLEQTLKQIRTISNVVDLSVVR